jgi:hypothetical protein
VFIVDPVATQQVGINNADIVSELKYSVTDYYTIIDNYITGLNATNRYTREPACQESFTNMMDTFYNMELNRTGTPVTAGDSVLEGQMLFVAKIISVEYRDTIRNCFGMSL